MYGLSNIDYGVARSSTRSVQGGVARLTRSQKGHARGHGLTVLFSSYTPPAGTPRSCSCRTFAGMSQTCILPPTRRKRPWNAK